MNSNATGDTTTQSSGGAFLANLLGGIIGSVGGSILNKPAPQTTNYYQTEQKKDNTALYIGIGAFVLIALVITVVIATRK